MAEVTNPCEADKERRRRAARDTGLVERVGDMERRVDFIVGYDHRAFPEACGGGGHGQHGMELRFSFVGPAGAVTWGLTLTNWVPGNVERGHVNSEELISAIPVRHPEIGDGHGIAISFHAPKPMYEGQEAYGPKDCDLLPSGQCYSDLSYLASDPVLEAFVSDGPHAVWAALARHYAEYFHAEPIDGEVGDGPA